MEGNYINGKKEDEWIWYFSNKKQHRRKSNYKDGELHDAKILSSDKINDLAVVKIDLKFKHILLACLRKIKECTK